MEVDLGHYSRRRIPEKVEAAIRLQEHTVRGMIFVCATARRARQLEGRLDPPQYPAMRVEFAVLTVDELSLEALDPWLRPGADDNGDLPDLSAWRGGA